MAVFRSITESITGLELETLVTRVAQRSGWLFVYDFENARSRLHRSGESEAIARGGRSLNSPGPGDRDDRGGGYSG
jgi:hypothetical protein